MDTALGFKAHSGWCAAVAVAAKGEHIDIVDRQRIELIDEGELWAKQPYHAAEDLDADEAREVVRCGIESAHRVAADRIGTLVRECRKAGRELVSGAVVIPEPMPSWSTPEILSVHIRMHKAEGVLFPNALCRAVEASKLMLVSVPEKHIQAMAEEAMGEPFESVMSDVVALGRAIGPPWGKDQKLATIAAMIALANINSAISKT